MLRPKKSPYKEFDNEKSKKNKIKKNSGAINTNL